VESELVSSSLSVEGECESEQTELSSFTYTNCFYKFLPYYLAIGMTPDEYWKQDCTLTKSYQEAFHIKKELQNEQLWLQGLYNYEALCDVLPAVVSLGKSSPKEYSKMPYPLTKKESEKRKRLKERDKYLKMKAMTETLVDSINKKFKSKEG